MQGIVEKEINRLSSINDSLEKFICDTGNTAINLNVCEEIRKNVVTINALKQKR